MTRSQQYVAAACSVVSGGVLAAGAVLDAASWAAVAWAGGGALVFQLVLHFALRDWRGRNDRFYAAMAAGFAARAIAAVAAVLLVAAPRLLEPAPFVLALGVFMVGVAFLEPVVESGLLARRRRPAGP